MSHLVPSSPQSLSPFLAPRFFWLLTVVPSLYHKEGMTIAKKGEAPEYQLQIDWRAALNEKAISAP